MITSRVLKPGGRDFQQYYKGCAVGVSLKDVHVARFPSILITYSLTYASSAHKSFAKRVRFGLWLSF
ncbi:hypothetical protein V6N12_058749 [Hibiscus sabdariffa]|uniref:Uncharacterized protein n=1 Tax=Hibiscus sabdariffa TaxID=183260 RepID=A0ABR2ETH8_9ROSI